MLAQTVDSLLRTHPAVRSVELVGSRACGKEHALSDWDFAVTTSDFNAVSDALPQLVGSLDPLAKLWDPLAEYATYMLILRGPTKVDFIFGDEPWQQRPPWRAGRRTLSDIDAHFWDWTLWLAQKRLLGRDERVANELEKMHSFLLQPLGVTRAPRTLKAAVASYLEARGRLEEIYAIRIPRELEREVTSALDEHFADRS